VRLDFWNASANNLCQKITDQIHKHLSTNAFTWITDWRLIKDKNIQCSINIWRYLKLNASEMPYRSRLKLLFFYVRTLSGGFKYIFIKIVYFNMFVWSICAISINISLTYNANLNQCAFFVEGRYISYCINMASSLFAW